MKGGYCMTDWDLIRDEVDQALFAMREGVATLEQVSDALLALAEHYRLDSAYIYGVQP